MADIGALVASVDGLAAADPSVLADGESIVVLHAQLERLTAVVTRAVARFEAGGEWAADGARSAAAWVSTRCRLPRRVVQRRIGLGRDLRQMPASEAAWLAGAIGEAQVVLLRSALRCSAEAFERDEAMLVAQAAELQHRHLVVALWRQLAAPEETEKTAADDRGARRAHLSPGLRGCGFLDVVFDPIGYAIFETSLAGIERELFDADWAEARARLGGSFSAADLRRSSAQRRHDAVVEMARRAQAMPGGGRLLAPLFTVHLDLETAKRVCELEGGTVVTPGSLVPWLAEAWLERVVHLGADRKISLGPRRRLFTGATRRALEVQHRERFHEYCDIPVQRCQIDHIEPYAAGGLTIDRNGRPACAFHNRQRHQPPPLPDGDEPP